MSVESQRRQQPETSQAEAPAPAAQQRQQQQQPQGPGLQAVQALTSPTPQAVASIIANHPGEQAAIAAYCHAHHGNAFMAQVFEPRAQQGAAQPKAETQIENEAPTGPIGAPAEVDASAIARQLVAAGQRNENTITNEVFWQRYPALRDIKLKSGTPAAAGWIETRNQFVRPALHDATHASDIGPRPQPQPSEPSKKHNQPAVHEEKDAEAPAHQTAPKPKEVTPPAAQQQQQQQPQPASAGPSAAGASAANDAYFTQSGNSYTHANSNWLHGSAAANTCNMTSLTMCMVSIAGSDQACRQKVADTLRRDGYHAGAAVMVNGKNCPLGKVLDDPELLNACQLEDLVTAAGIGKKGGYGDVTNANTIAKMANRMGVADNAVSKTSYLHEAKAREQAKVALASGKRIIAGTHNHFVYLIAVRDDGIVVHDPAGLRLAPGEGVNFMHGGSVKKYGHEWLSKMSSPKQREMALRRSHLNAENFAVLSQIAEIEGKRGKDRHQAMEELEQQFTGTYMLGALNFYALDELREFHCTVRITMEGGEEDQQQHA